MKSSYCFWSVADGPDALLASGMIQSARAVGCFKEFHLWTDRPIREATCHPHPATIGTGASGRLELLQLAVKKLPFTYYVYLAPDTCFVRPPRNLLQVLQGAPVHATFESDFTSSTVLRTEWEDCSVTNHATLMRFCGVRSQRLFNVDSGFWIVHREVIDSFCELAWDYMELCQKAGYEFSLEPILSYTVHMLCGNPYVHTLAQTAEVWAVDRAGCFAGNLPNGEVWRFIDYFTGNCIEINPALVRVPHSRKALAAKGQSV